MKNMYFKISSERRKNRPPFFEALAKQQNLEFLKSKFSVSSQYPTNAISLLKMLMMLTMMMKKDADNDDAEEIWREYYFILASKYSFAKQSPKD